MDVKLAINSKAENALVRVWFWIHCDNVGVTLWECVHICVHMCRVQRTSVTWPITPHLIPLRQHLSVKLEFTVFQLDQAASKPQPFSYLCLPTVQRLEVHMQPHPGSYMGSGNSNPNPYVCVSCTLTHSSISPNSSNFSVLNYLTLYAVSWYLFNTSYQPCPCL